MASDTGSREIQLDEIHSLLTEHGYEVQVEANNVLRVRQVDTGLVIRSVLSENILFNTLTCVTIPPKEVSADLMRTLLAADNGISTSSFQLYEKADGKVAVTLNNFCKLLAMGEDDADDILSCLEFLQIDAYAAHELLAKR